MRLQTKLILVFLFLALVPVAVSAFMVIRVLNTHVTNQRDSYLNNRLESLTERLDENFEQAVESLRLNLESFDFGTLENEQRQQILRILFLQRPYLNAIQLLDSSGAPLTPMMFVSAQNESGQFTGHVTLTNEEAATFVPQGLIEEAQKPGGQGANDPAIGAPITVEASARAARPEPQVPVVVACRSQGGARLLALMLLDLVSASGVEKAFEQFAASEPQAPRGLYLLDTELHALFELSSAKATVPARTLPSELATYMKGSGGGKMDLEFKSESFYVAWHSSDVLGLRAVMLQLSEDVYATENGIRSRFMYWTLVSIIVAVIFGFYFSRSQATPIKKLAAGVLDVARGNLDTRVQVDSADEIGELADTFNYMAGELKHQKGEIERQSEEIRSWNRELQVRVEARTRELKETQGYLIHSQKLAAVAELGAGVAHELNNPLAAVLGFTQILISRHSEGISEEDQAADPELKILKRIEEQSRRCRDIVSHLLRFSQEQVDRGAYEVVDMAELVSSVLKLFEGSFAAQRVTVVNQLVPGELMSYGNRAQLLQALLQMLRAVRPLLASGQALAIERVQGTQDVRLAFVGPMTGLSGPALDIFQKRQNQDQAMVQGLGLWLAHQILQEHKGSLQVEAGEAGIDSGDARLILTLPKRDSNPGNEGRGSA